MLDSPSWIKIKKSTINHINKKGGIKNDPQRIAKIKPFIDKYKWEEIYFSSEEDD